MNFSHTEDRRMLSDSLRRYFAEQYPIETRIKVAYEAPYGAPAKWQELAELGVLGMLVSEADGGFGGTGFDLAVVFEEVGRALCPEPLLAALLSLRALTPFGQAERVQAIAAGTRRCALAIFEDETGDDLDAIQTMATQSDGAWQLSGAKAIVYGAPGADELLVVAKTAAGLGLFAAQPSEIESFAMIDGGGAANVRFENAPAELIAEDAREALDNALDAGRLALCAEAVGACDVLLAMTAEYLTQRQQFGTVIATFQALQHRLVDMATEAEQARSMTILAASKLGTPEQARYLALAKNLIGRVATQIGEEATQLHGGIGMTWEYASSHYTKRLIMLDHQLGDRYQQLHRLLHMAA